MLQSIDTLIAFVVIMTVASLFVTITVQMLSAALSLRGKNLANALALTFQTIDPSLGEQAYELAAKILTDPLLSDSTLTTKDKKKGLCWIATRKGPWDFFNLRGAGHLASAIRAEEVYAVLRRLRDREQTAAKASPDAIALQEAATKILHVLVTPVDEAAAAAEKSATLAVEIDAGRAKFEAWFSSGQDRAQQWFQLHTRALTIAASILIALVLQLDAVEIFHHVSTNSAARNALVASADQVIKEADGALDERGGLLKRIADAATKPGQAPVNLAGINHTGELQAALAKRDGESFSSSEFERLVKETTVAYYKDRNDMLSELTRGVSATGFEFIPVGFWRWPAGDSAQFKLKNIIRHLPGIALFAALLTLGAPYWFNVLKNLASLRPALARAIGQDEAAKKPGKG